MYQLHQNAPPNTPDPVLDYNEQRPVWKKRYRWNQKLQRCEEIGWHLSWQERIPHGVIHILRQFERMLPDEHYSDQA